MEQEKQKKEEKNLREESQKTQSLKEELERVSQEKEEYLDGWKRAKADLINYKKDELKRLEEIAKFGSEEVIRDLIAVLDSFELALATLEKSQSRVEKGIYLIKSQLEDILRRRGLERIKVVLGDKFNPSFHEAIGVLEGQGESGNIAEEVEAGYTLYGKVLRPARVRLFK